MSARVFAAVDLGASSGRVMAGSWRATRSTLTAGAPLRATAPGSVRRSSALGPRRAVPRGPGRALGAGARSSRTSSRSASTRGASTTGCSTPTGALLGPADRLPRRPHGGVVDAVHAARLAGRALRASPALQFLPFNTIYQLAAEQRGPLWDKVAHVVLLPDLLALLAHRRTAAPRRRTRRRLGSRRRPHRRVVARAARTPRHPVELLPPIEPPGTVRGPLQPERRDPARAVAVDRDHDGRLARHRVGSRRRARDDAALRLRRRAARGRSSGSSSTSRS